MGLPRPRATHSAGQERMQHLKVDKEGLYFVKLSYDFCILGFTVLSLPYREHERAGAGRDVNCKAETRKGAEKGGTLICPEFP